MIPRADYEDGIGHAATSAAYSGLKRAEGGGTPKLFDQVGNKYCRTVLAGVALQAQIVSGEVSDLCVGGHCFTTASR